MPLSRLVNMHASIKAQLMAMAGLRLQTIRERGYYRPLQNQDAPLDTEYRSLLAEYAVASYLGLHWHSCIAQLFHPGEPLPRFDVANIEVRSTRKPHGELCIRRKDSDDTRIVLVRVDAADTCEIIGWCYGAARAQYESPDGSYWFVPDRALWDIEALRPLAYQDLCAQHGLHAQITRI